MTDPTTILKVTEIYLDKKKLIFKTEEQIGMITVERWYQVEGKVKEIKGQLLQDFETKKASEGK